MKKLIILSFLIILVACKKKETKPDPEPQPTTTGSTPTGNTVKIVYTPGASFGYLNIRWEYDYNTTTSDSGYINPAAITKVRLVEGDSIKLDWIAHTTSTGGTIMTSTIQVYVNDIIKQTWSDNGGERYYKVK